MLISPSRADCIIFGVDNVLTDSTAACSSAVSRCIAACAPELLGYDADNVDALPFYKEALSYSLFYDDVAWALLSAMSSSGCTDAQNALPSMAKWKDMLEAAGRLGIETLGVSSVARDKVARLCRQIYTGENGRGTAELEKPLFKKKWSKISMPVAVCTPRTRQETEAALSVIEWQDLPSSRIVCSDSYGKKGAIDSLCSKLGCRWPLYLGALPGDREFASTYSRGDFITIGTTIPSSAIRFSSAADALRAILGVF